MCRWFLCIAVDVRLDAIFVESRRVHRNKWAFSETLVGYGMEAEPVGAAAMCSDGGMARNMWARLTCVRCTTFMMDWEAMAMATINASADLKSSVLCTRDGSNHSCITTGYWDRRSGSSGCHDVLLVWVWERIRNKEGNVRVSASAASYQKSEVSFQLARAEDRPADLSACQPTAEFSTNCLPPLNQPDELRLFFQHAHRVKSPFRTKNVALSIMINYLRQIFI